MCIRDRPCPSPITKRPKLLGLLTSFAEQHEQADLAATARHIEPLLADHSLMNGAALDVVTMGTPVRYGWDLSGMGRLLHIVNHRNLRTDGKIWLSKMELPQVTMEMPIAWGGDYVQHVSYTHLTLPTSDIVYISVVAVSLKKKK